MGGTTRGERHESTAPQPDRGRLGRAWERLVEPPRDVVEVEARRRRRLLSSLLFVLTLTCALGFLASPPAGKMINGPLTLLLAGLFWVSRTRWAYAAVAVLLASLTLGIFAAVPLTGDYSQAGLTGGLVWLILPLVCGQIFLSVRGLAALVLAQLAGALSLPLWIAEVRLGDVWAAFGVLLTTGVLLLVSQRHRDLVERDRLTELDEVNRELGDEILARQEALAAAEAANLAKSRFLANMSHELRTPLNAIIGYVEIVLEEDEDDPRLTEDAKTSLQRALTASRHLLTIIGDILDLAKIEAGKLEVVPETVQVEDLVATTRELVAPLVAQNRNQFQVERLTGGALFTDVIRLRQCLLNLLSNASKFTQGGEVALLVRDAAIPEWIEFSVRDTGLGISASKIAAIFEPFVQADNSTTRRFGGTGLGLTLTRQLANLLGGTLSAKSALGKGSVFTLSIPRRYAPPAAPPRPERRVSGPHAAARALDPGPPAEARSPR